MRAAELLVWMGDFNYRIIGERDAVVGSIRRFLLQDNTAALQGLLAQVCVLPVAVLYFFWELCCHRCVLSSLLFCVFFAGSACCSRSALGHAVLLLCLLPIMTQLRPPKICPEPTVDSATNKTSCSGRRRRGAYSDTCTGRPLL